MKQAYIIAGPNGCGKTIFGIFIETVLTHGRYISALKKILYLLLLARKTDMILLMIDYLNRF